MKTSTKAGLASTCVMALIAALAADIAQDGKVSQAVTKAVMFFGGDRISGRRAESIRAQKMAAATAGAGADAGEVADEVAAAAE